MNVLLWVCCPHFFYRDNNEKAVELIGSSTSVDFNYFNNNDKLISCGKKVIDFFKKCNLSEEDKKNIAISLARKIVFQDIAYDEINAENIVNVAAMIFAEDKEFTVTDGMPDVSGIRKDSLSGIYSCNSGKTGTDDSC